MLNRTDVLANHEVKKAVTQMQSVLRHLVVKATFAEREAAALANRQRGRARVLAAGICRS